MNAKKSCALVLGGYVNGFSIIQDLYSQSITEIILFDIIKNLAAYSKKVKYFVKIETTPDDLYDNIERLHQKYERIVLFPTSDFYLENLLLISDNISSYCYLPFNEKNLSSQINKYSQYEWCESAHLPYPRTMRIKRPEDINCLLDLTFPVLIKPNTREDLKSDVFRNLYLDTLNDLYKCQEKINTHLKRGINFIGSEIIPGDGSNIYSYVCYRNKNGKILNEWTGKKLSQYPDDFGVFSSASNECPEEVTEQGRALVEGLDIMGIAQPEFKYDARDGKYKLMEINLRPMMWHRVGSLSGINLPFTQYCDALGIEVQTGVQNKNDLVHFVYLKHEIFNLLLRRGYFRTFKNNLIRGDRTDIALFDLSDLLPFLVDSLSTLEGIGKIVLMKAGLHKKMSMV